ALSVGTRVRMVRGVFVHGRSDAHKGQSRSVCTSRAVVIYYDRCLRPSSTHMPKLSGSFLTTQVSAFQHTPSSEASEGSRALPASQHSALPQSQHSSSHPLGRVYDIRQSSSTPRHQLLGSNSSAPGSIGALNEQFFSSAVLSASDSGALGERFGFGGSTMLLVSNLAVQRFGGSTFDGGVRSGPCQGSAIIRGRSRWLQPHPGEWFSSNGSGNGLQCNGGQQSVNSDGMRVGSCDAVSGGLQAAPRALLGSTPPSGLIVCTSRAVVIYYDRCLRPPATCAPKLSSSFLTTRVSAFQ
ncbi:hypothetical protein POSPLADRAFT_1114806, partial [Postia placenta MAD-698-R-SB12]